MELDKIKGMVEVMVAAELSKSKTPALQRPATIAPRANLRASNLGYSRRAVARKVGSEVSVVRFGGCGAPPGRVAFTGQREAKSIVLLSFGGKSNLRTGGACSDALRQAGVRDTKEAATRQPLSDLLAWGISF